MNSLTSKNVRNIYEQNYNHFLTLQKLNKKKLKSSERDKIKYKLYYEAQYQLNFSSPQCCLTKIDDGDVKLSELYKIYEQFKSTSIISLHSTDDLNKENLENSSSSGYSSSCVVPSYSSNENINSSKYSARSNNDKDTEIYEDDDVSDDFIQIVKAVQSESQEEIKNDNNNTVVRRTGRARKPVLYSEDLTHIQFISSPKYSSNSNGIKHSRSASSNKSSESKKTKNIMNSTYVTPINTEESLPQLSSPISSRTLNESTTSRNIFNDYKKQLNNYVKLRPLPKGSKASYLELMVSDDFARHMSKIPVRVVVGLMEPRTDETTEDQEIAAAVASINHENSSNSIFENPTIIPVKSLKRTSKPCNNRKKCKISEPPKSDLAKYIETFGGGNTVTDAPNITNYNNKQQTVPYQSPQNAGISTTTSESTMIGKPNTDLANAEWRTISTPNSNTITINEMLTGNQLEGDLENEIFFNIFNYIEGDNNTLTTNTVLESNNFQISTNSSAQNIVSKISSPGHITSTTATSSPRDITSTNQYKLHSPLSGDTSYAMNNTYLHPLLPSTTPQFVTRNHYERLSRNFQQLPTDVSTENQIINLPSMHQSSRIRVAEPGIDVLDLSQKHRNLNDFENRNTKEELILNKANNDIKKSPATKIASLDDYKKQHAETNSKLYGDTKSKAESKAGVIIRGRDMPLLVEDSIATIEIGNKNNQLELNIFSDTDVILPLNSKTDSENGMDVSSNLKQSTTDAINRKIEIVYSQVVQVPVNEIGDDKNLSVGNCDRDRILNKKLEYNREGVVNFNSQIIDNSNKEKIINNITEFDDKKSNDSENENIANFDIQKDNNNKTVENLNNKSVKLAEIMNNDSKSIGTAEKKTKAKENEVKTNNRKSVDELNGTQCIDEFLSMKDSADLDYEQEVDWDCLIINTSPVYAFDNDDEETTIENTKLELPSQSTEIKNISGEPDISGIVHKSASEIQKPQETITGTTNNTQKQIKKDFKIPKLNSKQEITCSSSTLINAITNKQIINRPSILDFSEEIVEAPQVLRCWPNNPTNILKLPTQNLNDLHPRISVPSLSLNSFSTLQSTQIPEYGSISCHIDNRGRYSNNILHIFGSPCIGWLKGNCSKENCRFQHSLTDESTVKFALLEMNDQHKERAYFETTRNLKLFSKYFVMFCKLFKSKVERLKIILVDCQKYAKRTDFLKPFRDALSEVGWTKIDAVQFIINNWNDNSTLSINCLIELIIDTDPSAFLSILEHYSKIPNYRYQVESINKLASIYNKYKNYDLMQILMNIIRSIPPEELLQENRYKNEELITFLGIVKNFNICTQFSSNNVPNMISNPTVSTDFNLPIHQQRTVKQDNLTKLLNQQLQPGHQNLFINPMQ